MKSLSFAEGHGSDMADVDDKPSSQVSISKW